MLWQQEKYRQRERVVMNMVLYVVSVIILLRIIIIKKKVLVKIDMSKFLYCIYLTLFLLGILLAIFKFDDGKSLTLSQNIEALAATEDILVITCLPEENSICVTYEVAHIMVDHYFSPH